MKAFLLAAGEGTRLRPLTFETPKCLLPIGGIPLLEIWYRRLEMQGVTNVLINTHHLAGKVEKCIHNFKTPIKTVVTHEDRLLGSAGTLKKNRDFVEGDDVFLIIYADSLTSIPLEPLVRVQREKKPLLTMALFHTDIPKESGIVTLDPEGRITGFVEKPEHPPGDLSNTGIMAASPGLFDCIPEAVPCDMSYHVIPNLLGRMRGVVTDRYFIDIGNLANYRTAQEKWEAVRGELGF
jgi:mannose-1-phosphate guanylyltransferase